MRFFILLIIVGCLMSCSNSKKMLLEAIEKNSEKSNATDSILSKMQKNNDLVVGYATQGTAWGRWTTYYFFCLHGKQWKAYKYAIKDVIRIGESRYSVDTIPLSKLYGDSVLSALKKNNSWEIMTAKKSVKEECPHNKEKWCSISDGQNVYLFIITKRYQNVVEFYEPDYYEYECCPGWDLRKRFLASINPVRNFFRQTR